MNANDILANQVIHTKRGRSDGLGFEPAFNSYFDFYLDSKYFGEALLELEDLTLHLFLRKNINDRNKAWKMPTIRQIRDKFGISFDKIYAMLNRLEKAHLLKKESGAREAGQTTRNQYILSDPIPTLTEFLTVATAGLFPLALLPAYVPAPVEDQPPTSATLCSENRYTEMAEMATPCSENRYAAVPESVTSCSENRYAAVPETVAPCNEKRNTDVPLSGTERVPESGTINRLLKDQQTAEKQTSEKQTLEKQTSEQQTLQKQIAALWKTTLEDFQMQLPSRTFATFLADTTLVGIEGGVAVIGLQGNYAKDFIEQRLGNKIKRALKVDEVRCEVVGDAHVPAVLAARSAMASPLALGR